MARSDDQRENLAGEYLKRGHATIKELLSLNMNWPPPGLDIVTDEHLNLRVSLLPATNYFYSIITNRLNSFDAKTLFGRARYLVKESRGRKKFPAWATTLGEERKIWIRKLRTNYLFRKASHLTELASHEAQHILQGDFSDPRRSKDVFGHSGVAPGVYADGVPTAHRVMSVMIADYMREMSPLQKIWRQVSRFNKWRQGQSKELKYLQEGIEIQARLSEVIIHSSHAPLNKSELSALLVSVGLKPPREVQRQLVSDRAFQNALTRYKAQKSVPLYAARQLNFAIRNMPQKLQTRCWMELLPMLYGDILESWGDRHGRGRMGFGINDNLPFLLFGKAYDKCHEPRIDPATNKLIVEKVHLLGVEESALFIWKHFTTRPVDPQNKSARLIKPADAFFIKSFMRAPGVTEELLKRAEYTTPLFQWLTNDPTWQPTKPNQIRPRAFSRNRRHKPA